MKKHYLVALLVFLVGCATFAREDFKEMFGVADPTRFDQPQSVAGAVSYNKEVRPILEQRCVVCHACYDAACQLKLGSYEGITRGATKEPVYDGARLTETDPTRLFVDADKPSAWRKKGFFPVLNEFPEHSRAEQQASLLARALDLKERHPLTPNEIAPAELDFSLDRPNQCPSIAEYSDFERKNPLMGMPFGMPAISATESSTLRRWLQQGAPYEAPEPLSASAQAQIRQWEGFLNGHSKRERLVTRFIYEHLFLANFHLEGEAPLRYYRMLRSSTPPGQPIREVVSRRPYEDPGVARVYYRLQPVVESIAAKTHMPYALSAKRMARWKELFFKPDYRVESLPEYETELAANPFKTFESIPVKSRYQFMLDEAEFSVMGFIKGPVCRGQTALNVINDHFWVFFQNPDYLEDSSNEFLDKTSHLLTLPSAEESNALVLTPWLRYSRQERKFLQAKSAHLEERMSKPGAKVTLDIVWDGDKTNQNAALTIYRHFDSATVIKGLAGEKPKTAWVIGFSLLERIHYLLTAGYDVYGNVGHQVNTRLYMNFLRMEGEFNFLGMLPQASRVDTANYWYRETDQDTRDLVYGKYAHFNVETAIPFTGAGRPEHELMGMLAQRLKPVLATQRDIATLSDVKLRSELQALAQIKGAALRWFPEASLLRIEEAGKPALNLSLLRNTAHLNITHLLTEHKALVPAENSLDVLQGIVAAYPNAFYRIQRNDLAEFTRQIAALDDESDYRRLIERFGVRRTSPEFWPLSDTLMRDYARSQPIEAGVMDLNRFENR